MDHLSYISPSKQQRNIVQLCTNALWTIFCVEENDLEILFQRIKYGDLAVQIFLDTELS